MKSAPFAYHRGMIETSLGMKKATTSGTVSSPSALVVLLGGIALGRAWFGVILVVAYGIGMALALVGTGFVLVKARTASRVGSRTMRTCIDPTRYCS